MTVGSDETAMRIDPRVAYLLALLLTTLEERLDTDTLDALIAGAILADLGIPANADLERLIERLRGYIGDEER